MDDSLKTNLRSDVSIIGPKELISGFSALGVKICDASTIEEAKKAISDSKSSIVFVVESLSSAINNSSTGALPATISIPDLLGKNSDDMKKLRELTERAIGSNILE